MGDHTSDAISQATLLAENLPKTTVKGALLVELDSASHLARALKAENRDLGHEIDVKTERLGELEAERDRLREALQDIADGMGETSNADIGRFAPAVARAALGGSEGQS